jgi:CheY-like chemotaxis protein
MMNGPMLSKPYRILVVEDDADLCKMLKEWFEEHHHCPTALARNAEDALELLPNQLVDVVITDNNMPGMHGLELANIIRMSDGPPVILMTGYYTRPIHLAAFRAGVRAFMIKPFRLEWMLEMIEIVVGRGLYYIGMGPPEGWEEKGRIEA